MNDSPEVKITQQGTELFCYKGKEIETDRKDNKIYDSVLPIYPGSGVHYLIDHLSVRKGDVALDLCTGSGVLGIYAAEKASKVIATDISERALSFVERNSQRNNILNIELRKGDLFSPVEGKKFDYIVSNPPFIPVPDNLKAALHSGGGVDGLFFVRKILRRVEEFLKPDGRMQLYSLSLGTQKESILEDVLKNTINNRAVTLTSLYSEPLLLDDFITSYKKHSVDGWRTQLKELGVTHLHSYVVNIEPGTKLRIKKAKVPDSERLSYPDDWAGWKEKFSFWILDNVN